MSAPLTLRSARQQLRQALDPLYGARESSIITNWVLEHATGWSREYCRMHPDAVIDPETSARIVDQQDQLLRWRPVQYVLGEAWFLGMKFQVDERVLIPRPETEELVEWVTTSVSESPRERIGQWRILDIGTGSGCIPIAIKTALPDATVWSLDASEAALAVAR